MLEMGRTYVPSNIYPLIFVLFFSPNVDIVLDYKRVMSNFLITPTRPNDNNLWASESVENISMKERKNTRRTQVIINLNKYAYIHACLYKYFLKLKYIYEI